MAPPATSVGLNGEEELDAFSEALYTGFFFLAVLICGHWMRKAYRSQAYKTGKAKDQQAKLLEESDGKSAAAAELPSHVVEEWHSETVGLSTSFSSWIEETSNKERIAAELPAMLEGAFSMTAPSQLLAQARALEVLQVVLTALVTKSCFREALEVHDRVASRVGEGCYAIWSMLLASALEAMDLRRCEVFFTKLRSSAIPSHDDWMIMLRVHLYRRDVSGLGGWLAEVTCFGLQLDRESRNRCIAICASKDDMELAEAFASEGVCEAALDLPCYSSLIQGYARQGKLDRCLGIFEQMKVGGVSPGDSYGHLLDACIAAGDVDQALESFETVRSEKVRLPAASYMKFVKFAAGAGELADAAAALDDMLAGGPGSAPNIEVYSTLVNAYTERGSVAGAVRVLEQMAAQSIPLRSIIRLILEEPSGRLSEPKQLFHTIHWLSGRGRQPRNDTLTLLVELLTEEQDWAKTLEVLGAASDKIGVKPQFAQYEKVVMASAQAGAFSHLVEAYAAMVRTVELGTVSPMSAEAHAALVQLCENQGGHAAARKVEKLSTLMRMA